MYIKWLPERLPEPGTAAEWTAGGFWTSAKNLPLIIKTPGRFIIRGRSLLLGGRDYMNYATRNPMVYKVL